MAVTSACAVGSFVDVILDRREAHRARLATGVKLAVIELKRLQPLARGADGRDFRVRRRIVRRCDLVPAAPNDFSMAHDDGTEWSATVRPHLGERKPDGSAHKFWLHRKMITTDGHGWTLIFGGSLPGNLDCRGMNAARREPNKKTRRWLQRRAGILSNRIT